MLRITKIGQYKIKKTMLPDLVFCSDIQIVQELALTLKYQSIWPCINHPRLLVLV